MILKLQIINLGNHKPQTFDLPEENVFVDQYIIKLKEFFDKIDLSIPKHKL